MAISTSYYGSVTEANTYFGSRLHELAWSQNDASNREKALLAATRVIDSLRFAGDKLDEDQELEFPRDLANGSEVETVDDEEVTVAPEAVRVACYELAYSLLDGRDPEAELDVLAITSQGYLSARTTYSRDQVPAEHLINGVPCLPAWRLLKPYLKDCKTVTVRRVS